MMTSLFEVSRHR